VKQAFGHNGRGVASGFYPPFVKLNLLQCRFPKAAADEAQR